MAENKAAEESSWGGWGWWIAGLTAMAGLRVAFIAYRDKWFGSSAELPTEIEALAKNIQTTAPKNTVRLKGGGYLQQSTKADQTLDSTDHNDVFLIQHKIAPINGGKGRDAFIVESSNNTITGGKGADLFFFNDKNTGNMVTDYDPTQDAVEIEVKPKGKQPVTIDSALAILSQQVTLTNGGKTYSIEEIKNNPNLAIKLAPPVEGSKNQILQIAPKKWQNIPNPIAK